ncbi:sugar ABC transporter permease [Nakamurella antarctica]|uniref:Sugar ABC transporter permease n=2 Tax=Nakamurella antarctica TaxID=1902245 RepID=A0A3G8ZQR8_9ACTN|nr:sugar ABC transporter permease [Nakamurella antarctica]
MVVAILLFALIVGAIIVAVDRPKIPNWLVVGGFLGPVVLVIGGGLFYPALRTLWVSFTATRDALGDNGKKIINPSTGQVTKEDYFYGFGNYGKIFSDGALQKVLLNTAMWVILVPLIATAIGLVYAVIIDRSRFEKFAKVLIFTPMAISMVGASIIWGFVYDFKDPSVVDNQIGLANQVLVWLGLNPVDFLRYWPWNTFALIVVMIWIQAGFAMTLLSAAIKGIPDDVIEAAKIDGASGMRLFRSITIPSIRPTLVVVITTIAMTSLKSFDIVRTMSRSNEEMSVVANEFYTQQFTRGQPAIAAALAVLLFIIVIPIIVYNVRQMRISEGMR